MLFDLLGFLNFGAKCAIAFIARLSAHIDYRFTVFSASSPEGTASASLCPLLTVLVDLFVWTSHCYSVLVCETCVNYLVSWEEAPMIYVIPFVTAILTLRRVPVVPYPDGCRFTIREPKELLFRQLTERLSVIPRRGIKSGINVVIFRGVPLPMLRHRCFHKNHLIRCISKLPLNSTSEERYTPRRQDFRGAQTPLLNQRTPLCRRRN